MPPQEPQYLLVDSNDNTLGAVYVDSNNNLVFYHDASGNEVFLGSSGLNDGTNDFLTALPIEDSGVSVIDANNINFGSNLSVTDDGDNSVTVDASGGSTSNVIPSLDSPDSYPELAANRPGQLNNVEWASKIGLTTNRSQDQVVLSTGSGWDSSGVQVPHVWWNDNQMRFEMLYTGFDGTLRQTGHAVSWDGINWTKNSDNPVIAADDSGDGSWDDGGVGTPFVYYDKPNSSYYAFLLGFPDTGQETGTGRLGVYETAETDFPTGWTEVPESPIIEPASGTWRSDNIWKSGVVRRGDTMYLFFNAGPQSDEAIGYATTSYSDFPTNWTVDDANSPVVDNTDSYDDVAAGDPFVVRRGNYWLMYYYARSSGGTEESALAYCTDSDFPTNWTKHPANPILQENQTSFDSEGAMKPVAMWLNNNLWIYYRAVDTESQIALTRDENGTSGITPPDPGSGGGSSTTTVDDFESGSLDSSYSGDTGSFTVQDTTVLEGSFTLQGDTTSGGGFQKIISTSGLNAYPDPGSTISVQVQVSGDNIASPLFGVEDADNHYYARVNASSDKIDISKLDGGSFTSLSGTSVTIPTNENLTAEIQYGSSGSHTFTLFDSADNQVAQVSATDSTNTGSGVGFEANSGGSSQESMFFDNYRFE